ncbi:MAG: zinc-ribbon domain-containing protein [bacterium]
MNCLKCGAENKDDASSCQQCGATIIPSAPVKTKNFSWLIALATVAVIIGIGLAIYFLWPTFVPGGNTNAPSLPQENLALDQIAPANTAVFLSIRSGDLSLAQGLATLAENPTLANQLSGFSNSGSDVLAEIQENLLPYLKANLQIAVPYSQGSVQFLAQVEVTDPSQAQLGLDRMEKNLQQKGIAVEALQITGQPAKAWGQEQPLLSVLRGNLLYLASDEQAMAGLLRGIPSNPLAGDTEYLKAKAEAANAMFFLYLDFAKIPDFPPQLKNLSLFAEGKGTEIHFKANLKADLEMLLNQFAVGQAKPFAQVFLTLLKTPLNQTLPFAQVPQDAGFALQSYGWLGSLVDQLLKEEGSSPFPFDLSWLDGTINLFLGEGKASGGPIPPIGLAVELTPELRVKAVSAATMLEQMANQLAGSENPPQIEKIGGIDVTALSIPGQGEVFFGLSDTGFYAAASRTAMEQMIKLSQGNGQNLGSLPAIKAAMQKIGKYHLCLYLDAKALAGLLSAFPLSDFTNSPLPALGEGKMILGLELRTDGLRIEGFTFAP